MATFFKSNDGTMLAVLGDNAKAPEGYETLSAGSVDAAREKHVPVVEIEHDGRVVHATVGEQVHPMEEKHFIEWIALEADDRLEVHYLKPGQAPTTFFAGGIKKGTVYAYCNLHGLWKATF